jgi:hypothetical protein
LITSPGARCCSIAFLLLALVSSHPLFPLQDGGDARAQARKALDASAQGRHEESYRIWADLYSKDPTMVGEDIHGFARSQIYMEVYKRVEELGDDCSRALEWTANGKRPGPPDYRNAADAFYPLLLMVEGVCLAGRKDYEQAYTQLSLAKAELRKVPDEDISDMDAQADHYLGLVKQHVISEDDYVTNKGLLQTWIGRVKARQGNTLLVEMTYVNKELGATYNQGQRVEVDLAACKELGAISADAAMKGWLE